MPLLVIYSIPENTKCPPKVEDDLGARVKIGEASWGQVESGNPTIYTVQVPDNSTVHIHAMHSLKPGKCTWRPVQGGVYETQVGSQTATYCVQCTCQKVSSLVNPLSGIYAAKRKDQTESFQIEMRFRENAEFCLVCDIHAPGAMDQARGFLHTKPEPGNHGIAHPGDFMNRNAPLTEGFLQGTFVGPHGENGSLRMVLALIPAANGMFNVHFGGFLHFAGSTDIETVFTSVNPIRWPATGVPA
jgi:hypothetical protein